eukprot:GSChrysophyteH2.ASY1.ANO1.1618.1 assembled CDS
MADRSNANNGVFPSPSPIKRRDHQNSVPQQVPGASAAAGHTVNNSIPLSIFPIAMDKFCICFAGLPGRGKTHMARRLARYLEFFHAIPVKMFNVNEYRWKKYGKVENFFFDPNNEDSWKKREGIYDEINAEVVAFMQAHPNGVAILDSTNATFERRNKISSMIYSTGAKMMFVEVQSDDETEIKGEIEKIIRDSPDYDGVSREVAESDFKRKLAHYASIYESIDNGKHKAEAAWNYIKCDLQRGHFIIHNVRGYLQQKIAHFIMNLRTEPHTFYLSRHGQSVYNAFGRIGGDSGLSQHGMNYAHLLAEFTKNNQFAGERPARLWTSTMRRTRETAQFIEQKMRPRAWHHLDELFAGACDGMTYEEIEEVYPEEFARRNEDKLAYRYPRGESYLDVIARLEPMIIEMERHREPLLIVGHQGILRIIYAFYMGLSRAEAPYVSIPLNNVLECKPGAFSCSVQNHKLYHIEAQKSDGQDEPNGDVSMGGNMAGSDSTNGNNTNVHASYQLDDGAPLSSIVEPTGSALSSPDALRTRTRSNSAGKIETTRSPSALNDVNNPHSH